MNRQNEFEGLSNEYIQSVGKIIPGYQIMHSMIKSFFENCLNDNSDILIIGAGGGAEMNALCTSSKKWNIFGIDPSEEMLEKARLIVNVQKSLHQIDFMKGYLSDLPESRKFNAATSVLVMHFLKDNGEKLNFLKQVRQHLKENGFFILVDFCGEKGTENIEDFLNAWERNAINSEVDKNIITTQRKNILANLPFISDQRENELLNEAGFKDFSIFYKAFMYTGWFLKT